MRLAGKCASLATRSSVHDAERFAVMTLRDSPEQAGVNNARR